MKRRCIKCVYGYNVTLNSIRIDIQCCGFGVKYEAVPVGKFCPIDGRKLQNLRKGCKKRRR